MPDRNLARVVAVANGKGGAGKTSVAANLAGLAAAAGWRTLLIDLDPQGNCGHDLGYGWPDDDGLVRSDHGAALVEALVSGGVLTPVVPDSRPGLDVISGGEHLDDVEDVVIGRIRRSKSAHGLLAAALRPLAPRYDLVVLDTPPTRPALLQLALTASRWIVVPSKTDRSSIEGLRTLAAQIALVRPSNPDLAVLGAVLFGVTSTASVVRRNAIEDIEAALAGAAPLFGSVIRHAEATAVEARERGLLVHEVAERVTGAEPFWKALREGRTPARMPGSASALAGDYVRLVREMLDRLVDLEGSAQADAGYEPSGGACERAELVGGTEQAVGTAARAVLSVGST